MKRIVVCGLNPSKAGWPKGDLTVTKVCGFAMRAIGRTDLVVLDGGAVFSPDQIYRYRLWRVLGAAGVLGAGANGVPATDAILRVDLVNVFGFISTDPTGLTSVGDPWGPENGRHVEEALEGADMAVAAWGSLPARPLWLRSAAAMLLLQLTQRGDVHALGLTRDGAPAHPSRLPYVDAPVLYCERRAAA